MLPSKMRVEVGLSPRVVTFLQGDFSNGSSILLFRKQMAHRIVAFTASVFLSIEILFCLLFE